MVKCSSTKKRFSEKGAVNPNTIKGGTVVDDQAATKTGSWTISTSAGAYVGREYLHDANAGDGRSSIRFEAELPTGSYEVRLAYSAHSNRAINVPVTIQHATGSTKVSVNQRQKPPIDDLFFSLGQFNFTSAAPAMVTVSNEATNGHVIADAVLFLPAEVRTIGVRPCFRCSKGIGAAEIFYSSISIGPHRFA